MRSSEVCFVLSAVMILIETHCKRLALLATTVEVTGIDMEMNLLIVPYRPDCGKATPSQLVIDLVATRFEAITKAYSVESSWSIFEKTLLSIE